MLYRCDPSGNPRHLAVGVDHFNYKLRYEGMFGGVSQVTGKKFEFVNGYSNRFWGWGGEDDDMKRRLVDYGKYKLVRPDKQLARFKMVPHSRKNETGNELNPSKTSLLENWKDRRMNDGYRQLEYMLVFF